MALKKISNVVIVLSFVILPAFAIELIPFTELQENPLGKMLKKHNAPKVKVCGYKDSSGIIIIKPQFAECGYFQGHYATVKSTGLDYVDDKPYDTLCIDETGYIVSGGACYNNKNPKYNN